jgi:glucose dehydrogenase
MSMEPGSRILRGLKLLIRSSVTLSIAAGFFGGASRAAQNDALPVTGARIENGDAEARNWLSYGRTYSEQRFSDYSG